MKKATLALAAAIAVLVSPAARAMDDWERQLKIAPDTLVRGVSIPFAFKGEGGKTHPAGLYDLKLNKGTQGILIGLLKNGKTVGNFPGKFVPGAADPPGENRGAATGDGSLKQGGATQGHDISIRKAGGAQDIHFDASSRVAFGHGTGGGEGKISCSNNLHPGGANLGFIWFELPAGQASGK